MHMNKPEGSHILIVQLHKTQLVSVVPILHDFTYKQETRIWHNKYILCILAWIINSIPNRYL